MGDDGEVVEQGPTERLLYLSVLYNWETRKAVVLPLGDTSQYVLSPGDKVYRACLSLQRTQPEGVETIVRDTPSLEEESKDERDDKVPLANFVARRIFGRLCDLVPKGFFGAGRPIRATNYVEYAPAPEGREVGVPSNVVHFQAEGMGTFKICVEKVG